MAYVLEMMDIGLTSLCQAAPNTHTTIYIWHLTVAAAVLALLRKRKQ